MRSGGTVFRANTPQFDPTSSTNQRAAGRAFPAAGGPGFCREGQEPGRWASNLPLSTAWTGSTPEGSGAGLACDRVEMEDGVGRGYRTGVALLLCVGAVACNETDAGLAAPESTPSVSVLASPAEEPSPSPTVAPVVAPPEVDLTAESDADFERVVTEILGFRDWLFAHPDQTFRIDTIYDEDCPCGEHLQEQLELIAGRDERVISDAPTDVVSVEVVSHDLTSVELIVTYRPPPAHVEYDNGKVGDRRGEYAEANRERWFLVRNRAGIHRLVISSTLS